MKNMTLENIAKACGGVFFGEESQKTTEITGVEKDSRLIKPGQLYLPFRGANVDGHDFIPQVFEKGAACTLSEIKLEEPAGSYVLVKSVANALKDIAEFYRKQIDCKVIGITGSVGKTSTKEIIASVLGEKFCVLKTEGNYNNEIGMPLTVLKIRDEHDIAVVEMGISDFGEMHRLSKVARPDACVITNIGTCHLENLKDRDGVFKAKTEIFDFAAEDCFVVLNGDDDKLVNIDNIHGNSPMFFGIENACPVQACEYKNEGIEGTKVRIKYYDKEFETRIPIPGYHMIYNALAATCIGVHYGMDLSEVDRGVRKLKSVSGRNNIIRTDKFTIIDDCYNANPMSMKAALEVLEKSGGRKAAILGDMFELGEDEAKFHRQVGRIAAKTSVDVVICIGKLAKEIANEACKGVGEVEYYETKEEFESHAGDILKKGDTILVKASNGMRFKDIVVFLSEMR